MSQVVASEAGEALAVGVDSEAACRDEVAASLGEEVAIDAVIALSVGVS